MDGIFAPLVQIAGLDHLLVDLRTADLDSGIRKKQYGRLRKLTIPPSDILLMGARNFIARIHCEDERYLVINAEMLSNEEVDRFNDFALSEGLVNHYLEEAFFLHLSFHFKGIYKLKKNFRDRAVLRNMLDIITPEYEGHSIKDLIECFDRIIVLAIPADNIHYSKDIWFSAIVFASNFEVFRSPLISADLAGKFETLAGHENIPLDNLYVALTAIHWKYTFFELYKCLEKIYYLPWHYKLKNEIGCRLSAINLAKICQSTIEWRAREVDSIKNLFELVDSNVFSNDVSSNNIFKDLSCGDASKSSYGRRVYKMRNILVHQQDYDDLSDLEISDADWPVAIGFMCNLIEDLYLRFVDDMKG